jgi:hypothetical protein
VQVVEEMAGPMLGHLPGTVEHVRVQKRANLRPVRRERNFPVALDLLRESGQLALGIVAKGLAAGAGPVENVQIGSDLIGRSGPDGVQLRVEARGRLARGWR